MFKIKITRTKKDPSALTKQDMFLIKLRKIYEERGVDDAKRFCRLYPDKKMHKLCSAFYMFFDIIDFYIHQNQ